MDVWKWLEQDKLGFAFQFMQYMESCRRFAQCVQNGLNDELEILF